MHFSTAQKLRNAGGRGSLMISDQCVCCEEFQYKAVEGQGAKHCQRYDAPSVFRFADDPRIQIVASSPGDSVQYQPRMPNNVESKSRTVIISRQVHRMLCVLQVIVHRMTPIVEYQHNRIGR